MCQMLTSPSRDAETTYLPSGLTSHPQIPSVCPAHARSIGCTRRSRCKFGTVQSPGGYGTFAPSFSRSADDIVESQMCMFDLSAAGPAGSGLQLPDSSLHARAYRASV